MVTPDQIRALAPASIDDPQVAEIISRIDRILQDHGSRGGQWPLVIPTARSMWSNTAIAAALAQYRAAGWAVMRGAGSALCAIEPAIAGAIANRVDDGLRSALDRAGDRS